MNESASPPSPHARAEPARPRPWRAELTWIVGLVALSEAVAFVNLATAGWNVSHDARWLAPYTFGLRPHHAHVGVVVLLLAAAARRAPRVRRWAIRIGVALIVADFFHHFCVQWPMTGAHGFDLVFPREG